MTAIISLTTHKGRAAYIMPTMEPLVEQAGQIGAKVCLAVQEDVVSLLPAGVLDMEKQGLVEILTAPRDHGSAMKFTLAMMKHPDLPVIAVDDDNIFMKGTLAGMLNVWHKRLPDTIICRRARQIVWNPDGSPARFRARSYPLLLCRDVPAESCRFIHNGFPEHNAGVLYPPGCFNITDADIEENLSKSPHDDDVFAHVLALRHCRNTVLIHDPASFAVSRANSEKIMEETSLWKEGRNGERTTEALRKYTKELALDKKPPKGL